MVAVEAVEEEVDRVDLGRDVENNLQELRTTPRIVLDLIVMRQLVLLNIFLLTNSKYTPVGKQIHTSQQFFFNC